jgi:hypothetical protein
MNLRTYEKDKAIIPDSMDDDLGKYDVGEMIKGKIGFDVDSKDAKEITICIHSFSCKPQKRMKNEEKE